MDYENCHSIPSSPLSLFVVIQWVISRVPKLKKSPQDGSYTRSHIVAYIAHVVEAGCSNPDHSFVVCSVDISMAIFRYIIDRSMRRAHALFLSPSHTPTLGQTLCQPPPIGFSSPLAHTETRRRILSLFTCSLLLSCVYCTKNCKIDSSKIYYTLRY